MPSASIIAFITDYKTQNKTQDKPNPCEFTPFGFGIAQIAHSTRALSGNTISHHKHHFVSQVSKS